MEQHFIYILSNENHTALHTGWVEADKLYHWYQRVKYHPKSFSAPYVFDRLVYYETFPNLREAIRREKEIKNWSRTKQMKLVKTANGPWTNLLEELMAIIEKGTL